MGIVAFQWGENKLTLVQNREKCDPCATKPAIWDEDHKILRSQSDHNLGTWFGISTKGKVFFIVDPSVCNNLSLISVLRPVDFLRGETSPWDYTTKLSEHSAMGKTINNGLVFDIIVADIKLNSMFYIAKKSAKEMHVTYQEVDFGVHTLSSVLGLNSNLPKELRMKDLFNEMITNKKVPTLKEMAENFVYKSEASSSVDILDVEDRYSTMSTIALEVKPTKEAVFYEKHLVNGKWEEHDFPFSIQ